MIIDDGFLTQEEIDGLKETFLGQSFPWHLHKQLLTPQNSRPFYVDNIEEYQGFQFGHTFYFEGQPQSEYCGVVFELFQKFCAKNNISAKAFLRIKANLTFPDGPSELTQAPHIDHPFPHKVFLYYVNDSDGDTIIYDKKFTEAGESVDLYEKERVTPKAGRAIFFDGLTYHTPLTPLSTPYRAVINVTFLD